MQKLVRLTTAALVAVLAALAFVAAGAGGNGRGHAYGHDRKPAKPAHDKPTVAGLRGQGITAKDAAVVASTAPAVTQGEGAPGSVGASTLVLYDSSGPYGWLGELYAMATANLASHFGPWQAEPVAAYQPGQIEQHTATIYLGSSYDEPLPDAFLDDVHAATKPVVWVYDNIWELTNRFASTFQSDYGWNWKQFDTSPVSHVLYRGVELDRDAVNNGGGIMDYWSVDETKATVLAWAIRDADGSRFPWAIRSGTLTYVGENPFVYTGETDRLIAFEDMLYDVLDPQARTRHRALVRLEDISPAYDPAQLKAVADYLDAQGIPFGFGVMPIYTDPNGYYTGGTPEQSRLRQSPVADMVRYLQAHGGTLVMHGYTHQYSNVPNPYTAVSGDDFEFFRVVENADHTLDYVGPVAEDSEAWALDRIDASFREFQRAKVSAPAIFEFPHYAASAADYRAAAQRFATRWERGMYYGGVLSGGTVDYGHAIGQSFPYLVRDVYGTTVLPENLGAFAPEPFYQFPPHTVADILEAGEKHLAIRDGFASFYYHPFEGVDALRQIVDGLRAQGWTFVSPDDVAANG